MVACSASIGPYIPLVQGVCSALQAETYWWLVRPPLVHIYLQTGIDRGSRAVATRNALVGKQACSMLETREPIKGVRSAFCPVDGSGPGRNTKMWPSWVGWPCVSEHQTKLDLQLSESRWHNAPCLPRHSLDSLGSEFCLLSPYKGWPSCEAWQVSGFHEGNSQTHHVGLAERRIIRARWHWRGIAATCLHICAL